jgi:hypothetical protein
MPEIAQGTWRGVHRSIRREPTPRAAVSNNSMRSAGRATRRART